MEANTLFLFQLVLFLPVCFYVSTILVTSWRPGILGLETNSEEDAKASRVVLWRWFGGQFDSWKTSGQNGIRAPPNWIVHILTALG